MKIDYEFRRKENGRVNWHQLRFVINEWRIRRAKEIGINFVEKKVIPDQITCCGWGEQRFWSKLQGKMIFLKNKERFVKVYYQCENNFESQLKYRIKINNPWTFLAKQKIIQLPTLPTFNFRVFCWRNLPILLMRIIEKLKKLIISKIDLTRQNSAAEWNLIAHNSFILTGNTSQWNYWQKKTTYDFRAWDNAE